MEGLTLTGIEVIFPKWWLLVGRTATLQFQLQLQQAAVPVNHCRPLGPVVHCIAYLAYVRNADADAVCLCW